MDRYGEREGLQSPERTVALEDVRRLARSNMRHRDLEGLAGLLDDYFALGDELEVVPTPEAAMKSERANDGDTIPASSGSTRAA